MENDNGSLWSLCGFAIHCRPMQTHTPPSSFSSSKSLSSSSAASAPASGWAASRWAALGLSISRLGSMLLIRRSISMGSVGDLKACHRDAEATWSINIHRERKVNLGLNLAHSRAHLGQLEQPPPHPLVPPSEDIQAGPRISWTPLLLHPKTKKESKRATSQGGSRAFLQRSSTFLPPLTPSQSSWPSLPEQPPPRPFTVVFHFLPFQSILNLWISLHITGIWKENHLSWKKLIKNHECLPI